MLRAKIFKGGKIIIPALYRKQLLLSEGQELLIDVQDDKIVISSLNATLKRIREKVNQHHPSDVSLVDQLIANRRLEASHE